MSTQLELKTKRRQLTLEQPQQDTFHVIASKGSHASLVPLPEKDAQKSTARRRRDPADAADAGPEEKASGLSGSVDIHGDGDRDRDRGRESDSLRDRLSVVVQRILRERENDWHLLTLSHGRDV